MADHVMTDLDCRKEIVKFRPRSGPRRGRIVQFTRQVGVDCPKRRKPSTRHLRPYQYESRAKREARADDPRFNGLGESSCSTWPRWARGGLGFLLGGMVGSMIGGGLAVAVATAKADMTAPFQTVNTAKRWWLIGSGVTLAGAVGGLWVAAAKPEC